MASALSEKLGMLFDTTSVNSGHTNGACAIFELELLCRKPLWLACCHNVFEVVLEAKHTRIFAPPISPEWFVNFRDNLWSTLNLKSTKH